MKVNEMYKNALVGGGDIYQHLPTLLKYGTEVNSITEMGVRRGVSTLSWLMSKPEKLVCIDIKQHKLLPLDLYKQWALENSTDFTFIEANTREIEIKETDLLFIDTLHTYDQLKIELNLHADKAKKYMIFHDTVTFGTVGMEKNTRGLMPAIDEYMAKHQEWQVKEHFKNNNGLLILEKVLN